MPEACTARLAPRRTPASAKPATAAPRNRRAAFGRIVPRKLAMERGQRTVHDLSDLTRRMAWRHRSSRSTKLNSEPVVSSDSRIVPSSVKPPRWLQTRREMSVEVFQQPARQESKTRSSLRWIRSPEVTNERHAYCLHGRHHIVRRSIMVPCCLAGERFRRITLRLPGAQLAQAMQPAIFQ